MSDFKVTRKEITDAALSMLGWRFRHQGRGEKNRVDCVGFLVLIGQSIGYPEIFDLNDYRRTPSASDLKNLLLKNCDEINLEEVRAGDFYLMKLDGCKPRHTAVRLSDETDLARGIEPQIIHAYGNDKSGGVIVEPVRQWQKQFVTGFRVRGLVD